MTGAELPAPLGPEYRYAGGNRAQSHVVGAVLLLGLTMVALAALTAAVGAIVEDQTARADAGRVAADLEEGIEPVATTGHHTGSVRFASGHVGVEQRRLRVFDNGSSITDLEGSALVFEAGDRRVAAVAGAITRGRPGNARLVRDPPIAAGEGVLVVGAVKLNGSGAAGGSGGVVVPLETNVSHERFDLGNGSYSVAIETETPAAFERHAAGFDAETDRVDFDGDGVPSVVIEFEGNRTGFVVVHDMRLEVGHG